MIDWGAGRYEPTAAELEPAAEHVVALAGVRAGERVLDIATGTGNAALIAARAGGRVSGVDVAPRLIEVARARAGAEGTEASFLVGDMAMLPFEDGGFDLALSVFGMIFADDADRAFGEMIRVLNPGGRAFLSAWVPAGPVDAMVSVFARAIAEITGSRPPRFAWHESRAVSELAARHGARARFHEAAVTIVAESPEAYLNANQRDHPMSVVGRPLLERAGVAQATRERALAGLREGNEDPAGFRVRSPYVVIEVTR
jgi:SAM-dependent methyltransferase